MAGGLGRHPLVERPRDVVVEGRRVAPRDDPVDLGGGGGEGFAAAVPFPVAIGGAVDRRARQVELPAEAPPGVPVAEEVPAILAR